MINQSPGRYKLANFIVHTYFEHAGGIYDPSYYLNNYEMLWKTGVNSTPLVDMIADISKKTKQKHNISNNV